LNSHFYDGGFYPVGGASEIALNIIPVIERSGGKVLVRANVKEILVRNRS
jgi:all-trans-retinol 13,14-reductase